MSGTIERLIYMANQIARNFATHPDPAAATADHIAKFWDPRMKAMILRYVEEGGALAPAARAAIEGLRDLGAPPPQTHATEFNAVDEAGGSDAG